LSLATKKATLNEFDTILGLGLEAWSTTDEMIPQEVWNLAQKRQQARREKRWQDADALREQIAAAGYDVQDTPEGPRLYTKK
jgi:cysteinyl-tRNA synthetase